MLLTPPSPPQSPPSLSTSTDIALFFSLSAAAMCLPRALCTLRFALRPCACCCDHSAIGTSSAHIHFLTFVRSTRRRSRTLSSSPSASSAPSCPRSRWATGTRGSPFAWLTSNTRTGSESTTTACGRGGSFVEEEHVAGLQCRVTRSSGNDERSGNHHPPATRPAAQR